MMRRITYTKACLITLEYALAADHQFWKCLIFYLMFWINDFSFDTSFELGIATHI